MFQLKTDTYDECYYKFDEGTTILAQVMICGFILEIYNYGTVGSSRLALHVFYLQGKSAEADAHFARALGAAKSGNGQMARQGLDKLEALRERTAETSAYWAKQVEIQRLSAMA